MDEQQTLLAQISTLVHGCEVSDQDQQVFMQIVSSAPAPVLHSLLETFSSGDPFEMKRFVTNLAQKYLAQGNIEKTKELIEQDKYELNTLLATINE